MLNAANVGIVEGGKEVHQLHLEGGSRGSHVDDRNHTRAGKEGWAEKVPETRIDFIAG